MDKNIESIVFFGSDYRIAQKLNSCFPISTIWCERRHFNLDLFNYSKLNSIEINFIDKLNEIELHETPNSLGFSYGVSWIFKKKHIDAFSHGIWNIHTGKLPDNRGRHPISWSFINNDNKFYISIHAIDEKIDSGKLLAEGFVHRDINDTQDKVMAKLNNLLIDKIIDEAFENYNNNNMKSLENGIYNKSLAGEFENIDPKDYDSRFIFNLFKSQYVYGGVTIDNINYLHCDFYNEDYTKIENYSKIVVCKDGIKLGIK